MRTRIKNKEECRKLFWVEVPRETVREAADKVYREIKKIAKIPGFRPGTAPQDLLEKHYSKDAEEEILKRLIPSAYREALLEHKVVPVGVPRVFNIDFAPDKPLTFEAEVDTRPVIKLKRYSGIKVKKKRISAPEEEVRETLGRLQNIYAKFNDVDRPVKKDDYAVCDVECFMNGKPITKRHENMWIAANKEASLLGKGEELIGLSKGQEKEFDARLPENYPDKKYAAKDVKFRVRVKEVKEKELPALDDELAKKMNAGNVEALKKDIESQILLRKEKDLRTGMQNQVMQRLLSDNKFAVPSDIVRRQEEVIRKRLETELAQKGIGKDEIAKKIKEMDPGIKTDAKTKVRLYFILDDIAAREKIEVGKKDLEERFAAIAISAKKKPEEIKEYYEKENLVGGLTEEIKEDKVLDFLLDKAEITEA